MNKPETQGTFEDILALATPDLRPLCVALRDLIASLDPSFTEVVWPKLKIASFGVGPKKMTQHYAYIAVQPSHINLGFYRGASLPDPDHLLEGSGKGLRHIKIRELATTRIHAITTLLHAAIGERRPYATEV